MKKLLALVGAAGVGSGATLLVVNRQFVGTRAKSAWKALRNRRASK